MGVRNRKGIGLSYRLVGPTTERIELYIADQASSQPSNSAPPPPPSSSVSRLSLLLSLSVCVAG
jgi:hypothetical protein